MCVSQERFEVRYKVQGGSLYKPDYTGYMTPIKGGYMLTGSGYKTYGDTYKSFIVSLLTNEHGRLTYSKCFAPSTGQLNNFASKLTSDGKLLIFLSIYNTNTKKNDGGFVFKSDLKGNIEWSKIIKSATYSIINPQLVQEDEDGNFFLVSTVNNVNFLVDDRIEVIKLNKNGVFLWNTLISSKLYRADYYISTSVLIHNNRIFISGYRNCQECEGKLFPRLLQLEATSGKFLSFKTFYCLPTDNGSATIESLYARGDSLYMSGTSNYKYIRASFNDTTTTTYADALDYTPYTLQYYLLKHKKFLPYINNSVIYNDNGSKTVYSSFPTKSVDFTLGMYLLKYDTLGRSCPIDKAPPINSTNTKLLMNIINSSYEILKDSIYLNNAKVYAFDAPVYDSLICSKDEERLNNSIAQSSIVKQNKNLIYVYPNPAADKLQLKFNCSKPQQTQVLILNVAGQMVQSLSTNSVAGYNQLSLDVHSLSQGMYTIQIVGKEQIRYSKFIKD